MLNQVELARMDWVLGQLQTGKLAFKRQSVLFLVSAMRTWLLYWQTLIQSLQGHPLQCVDLALSLSAIFWLGVWLTQQQWPFLVLGSSYAIGLAIANLVREAIAPSPQSTMVQASALILLVISLCSFADLLHYF